MATDNVYLFYANIIGYLRIATALACYWYMHTIPWLAMAFYATSQLLDETDGYLARKFNQCSNLGYMLDMLTDQCTLVGLLIGLAELYPAYSFLFKVLTIVNVAGPWLYMVAGYAVGDKTGYRSVGTAMVDFYFTNKNFLSFLCLGNEAFHVTLFLAGYYPNFLGGIWYILAVLTFPIGVGKTFFSLIRIVEGARWFASLDFQERKFNKMTAKEN